MANVATSWRLIENVLQQSAPKVFQALRKPASEADLRRLEKSLPGNLPRSFVESLRIHDGLRNSHLGEIRLFDYWALLPINAILREWRGMTDLQAAFQFSGCQIKITPRVKKGSHWRAGWIPFMDADGGKLLIDLDPGSKGKVGQIIRWSNSGSFSTIVIADSFGAWLATIADILNKRHFQVDEFGGIWVITPRAKKKKERGSG